MKNNVREPNRVISLAASHNDNEVGVISGKYCIKDAVEMNQLFIFQKKAKSDPRPSMYQQIHKVVLKEIPFF
jgi:hypothetical protein